VKYVESPGCSVRVASGDETTRSSGNRNLKQQPSIKTETYKRGSVGKNVPMSLAFGNPDLHVQPARNNKDSGTTRARGGVHAPRAPPHQKAPAATPPFPPPSTTGQIGYALCPMVAAGRMLGPNQKVILHLLDIPPAAQALEGVKMELLDAAFPLLEGAPRWAVL